jgi:hypothetical protein
MAPRPFALAALALLPACAAPSPLDTDEGQLRRRAAFDFDCSSEGIALTPLGGAGPPLERWGAVGCGQRAVYQCVARDTTVNYPRGVCVWQRESALTLPLGDAGPADTGG